MKNHTTSTLHCSGFTLLRTYFALPCSGLTLDLLMDSHVDRTHLKTHAHRQGLHKELPQGLNKDNI